MKRFFYSRISLGVVCFLLGIGTLYFFEKYIVPPKQTQSMQSFKNLDPLFDQFYNDSFFSKSFDPFDNMRQMRERMEKQFEIPKEGSGIFDSWFKKRFGGGNAEEISKREDDDFVYYDVKVDGLDQEKVNVSVTNGLLSISGKIEKKAQSGNSENILESSFQRSIPLPSNVDSEKVQMEQGKDKVTVKFPKLKQSHY